MGFLVVRITLEQPEEPADGAVQVALLDGELASADISRMSAARASSRSSPPVLVRVLLQEAAGVRGLRRAQELDGALRPSGPQQSLSGVGIGEEQPAVDIEVVELEVEGGGVSGHVVVGGGSGRGRDRSDDRQHADRGLPSLPVAASVRGHPSERPGAWGALASSRR